MGEIFLGGGGDFRGYREVPPTGGKLVWGIGGGGSKGKKKYSFLTFLGIRAVYLGLQVSKEYIVERFKAVRKPCSKSQPKMELN